MAVSTTYAELQAEIALWTVRDDLTDIIPSFIGYAENRLNQVLRLPEMESEVTTEITAASVSLPADLIQIRSLYLEAEPQVVLEPMGVAKLRELYSTHTGSPRSYALQSGVGLLIGPAPDTSYDLVLNYYARIPALSDDNETNWLLAANPGLYLAASLAEAFAYMVDDARGKYWDARTVRGVSEMMRQSALKAKPVSSMRIRSIARRSTPFNIITG